MVDKKQNETKNMLRIQVDLHIFSMDANRAKVNTY